MTKSKFKVVMTDYDFDALEYISNELAKVGAGFIPAQCKTEDEVIELARDADGLVNEYFKPINKKIITSLEKCKVIARTGIGVDTIDLQAATERGIYVVNVPAYCLDEVSDEAMALLLSSVRKTCLLNDAVKSGNWDYKIAKPIYRLRGKTLGLAAFGKIPKALVPKAKGFGLDIIFYDPYLKDEIFAEYGVERVEFGQLLARSDIISIHTPLTDETREMFGEDEFKAMKKTAIVINTARGPIIDNKALYKALSEGWISGAGLDVMQVEPPEENEPLLKLENVVITSHSAWYSEESIKDLLTTVGREVARVLAGQSPLSLVNPEVLKKEGNQHC